MTRAKRAVVVGQDQVIESITMQEALDFMLKEIGDYLLARENDIDSYRSNALYEALHMFVDTFHEWWY